MILHHTVYVNVRYLTPAAGITLEFGFVYRATLLCITGIRWNAAGYVLPYNLPITLRYPTIFPRYHLPAIRLRYTLHYFLADCRCMLQKSLWAYSHISQVCNIVAFCIAWHIPLTSCQYGNACNTSNELERYLPCCNLSSIYLLTFPQGIRWAYPATYLLPARMRKIRNLYIGYRMGGIPTYRQF